MIKNLPQYQQTNVKAFLDKDDKLVEYIAGWP